MINVGFRDLTQLHKTLRDSIADLPPELRFDIAKQLLAADKDE